MMRFTKLLIIFALLFVSVNCRAKEEEKLPYKDFKPFKMVFLPDVYLTLTEEETDSPILHRESLVIFQDVIKNLNNTENLDFVVFGGNLTANEDSELADMPMFLDVISELNTKYYAIPGDREADSKENFIKEFEEFKNQTFWSAEPVEDVLLIGLDTSLNGKDKGYVNIHQIFWLDTILKNNMDKFTIITMHHPPHTSLEKPDLFMEILRLYPQIKLILGGHERKELVIKENEKIFMTCPSIVSYPNKYKILEIYPDRVEVDTEKISFKQIIKKAKKKLGDDYQKPDGFSRKGKYYYGEPKKKFLFFF